MISINIICVGKLKEKYLRDACVEYEKRLGAYCKFSIIEVRESKICDNPSEADISRTLELEGESILSKLQSGSYVVAMCIEGEMMSSPQLSDNIERIAVCGTSNLTFIIGGSYGLSDKVKRASDLKLSISRMTFPHQLARVMLCEQIYRAFQISSGGKYHK